MRLRQFCEEIEAQKVYLRAFIGVDTESLRWIRRHPESVDSFEESVARRKRDIAMMRQELKDLE